MKIEKNCKKCGKIFLSWVSQNNSYCSRKCYTNDKENFYSLIKKEKKIIKCVCGETFKVLPSSKKIYCSKKCMYKYGEHNKGEKAWNYKGGYVGKNGYKYIRENGKYVLEHKNVYEKYYGIKIKKGYCVHHIDRNKLNNTIENLEIMSRKEHARLHHIKLSKEDVEFVIYLSKEKGFSHRKIGKIYGIDNSAICRYIQKYGKGEQE
jgi:hypothetical protein